MKVYFVELEGEGEIYCYEDPKDALGTIEAWSTEDLKTSDPEEQQEIREEVAAVKGVLSEDEGGFTGEWCSVWIEVRSRQWFNSLPHDLDEAFQEVEAPTHA